MSSKRYPEEFKIEATSPGAGFLRPRGTQSFFLDFADGLDRDAAKFVGGAFTGRDH